MPRTLLLADDSVTIQKVVGLSFASEDIELVSVDNGDEAVARAREIRPDLVLADVVMPGRNGYEVCAALQADPETASIPVLLLTGIFESFDEERAARVGARGHITKPFEARTLVERVAQEMASPPAAAEVPASSEPAPEALTPPAAAAPAEALLDDDLTQPQRAPLRAPLAAAGGDELDFEDEADALGFDALEVVAEEPDAAPAGDPGADARLEAPGEEAEVGEPAPAADPLEAGDLDFGFGEEDAAAAADIGERLDDFEDELGRATLLDPDPERVFDVPAVGAAELSAPDDPDSAAESRSDAEILGEVPFSGTTSGDAGPDPLPAEPPAAPPVEAGGDAGRGFDDLAIPGERSVADGMPTLAVEPSTAGPDLTPVLRERLHDALEKVAWEAFADLSEQVARQALEQVEAIAWEVIPKMAEAMVLEEIRRMKGEAEEE